MKTVFYTPAARDDLRKHRADAKRIVVKIARFAETGRPGKRLRIGD